MLWKALNLACASGFSISVSRNWPIVVGRRASQSTCSTQTGSAATSLRCIGVDGAVTVAAIRPQAHKAGFKKFAFICIEISAVYLRRPTPGPLFSKVYAKRPLPVTTRLGVSRQTHRRSEEHTSELQSL